MGQTFAACERGGKERLVTIRQVFVDVAGMLAAPIRLEINNYIYLPYWSHDKALLILLTRLRSVRQKFCGVL